MNALRVALRIVSGIIIFICSFETPAGVSKLLFHRRGRKGKRQVQRSLPRGAVAQRLRGFKSAEPEKTVKRSSRRTGVNLQFFPVQPSALGLKGASSPFFVAPARRNRWHFSGSLLVSKENIPRPLPFSLTQFYATIPVTKTFGETPMLYYAAPMEGFTDRVWRQTHQKLSLIHI